jgi:hypothetical protein
VDDGLLDKTLQVGKKSQNNFRLNIFFSTPSRLSVKFVTLSGLTSALSEHGGRNYADGIEV